MITKEWTNDGHADRVTISRARVGWEVRTERDGRVIKRRAFADWHQVERAVRWFDLFDGTGHIKPDQVE